jgi:hypothetical protein
MELDGSEWSALRRFTPGERAPGNHWIGRWVDRRAGLAAVAKRKKSLPLLGIETRSSSRSLATILAELPRFFLLNCMIFNLSLPLALPCHLKKKRLHSLPQQLIGLDVRQVFVSEILRSERYIRASCECVIPSVVSAFHFPTLLF